MVATRDIERLGFYPDAPRALRAERDKRLRPHSIRQNIERLAASKRRS